MALFFPRKGILYDCDVDGVVYVNTVNCVGVQGAGVALECKQRYPELHVRYKRQCDQKLWKPGMVSYMEADDGSRHLFVSTKDHWRNPSQMIWVESILEKIAESVERLNIDHLAISHLGAGNGGLDPSEVRKQMDHYLGHTLLEIYLYSKGR